LDLPAAIMISAVYPRAAELVQLEKHATAEYVNAFLIVLEKHAVQTGAVATAEHARLMNSAMPSSSACCYV